jgi:hypothetical protein
MRKTHIAAAIAALLIVFAGGWYFLSPAWTLTQMVAAARANDEDKLSAYIDYPMLRRDMKADLTARMKAEAKRENNPKARMGLAMGMAMVGPMVDAMISPAGMKTAFAAMDKKALVAAAKAGVKAARPKQAREPRIERLSFDRFLVYNKETPGSGLVFERRGLGWKLAGIDLPAEPPAISPR